MATAKPSRSGSRSSTSKKKKSAGTTRSYTILKKSRFDPKKKLSSQGKSCTTTKTGAQLAARVATKRRVRPSRIYLYRNSKVYTYSMKYVKSKDGVTKAVAKLVRSVLAKRKTEPSKTKTTGAKKTGAKRKNTLSKTEVASLKKVVAKL